MAQKLGQKLSGVIFRLKYCTKNKKKSLNPPTDEIEFYSRGLKSPLK